MTGERWLRREPQSRGDVLAIPCVPSSMLTKRAVQMANPLAEILWPPIPQSTKESKEAGPLPRRHLHSRTAPSKGALNCPCLPRALCNSCVDGGTSPPGNNLLPGGTGLSFFVCP